MADLRTNEPGMEREQSANEAALADHLRTTVEQWRPCPGFPGYEVSSHGRARRVGSSSVRTTVPNHDGYLMVSFNVPGKTPRNRRLHRLVCEAFHGPPNLLHCEAAHLDGNRANARADNLKWVSRGENCHHRKLHGSSAGERHPRAKLTWEAVRAIRASEEAYACLAARYGVSWSAISDVKRGRRWKESSSTPYSLTPIEEG